MATGYLNNKFFDIQLVLLNNEISIDSKEIKMRGKSMVSHHRVIAHVGLHITPLSSNNESISHHYYEKIQPICF